MLISKFHYTLCLCLGRWLSSLSFRNPYAIKCSSLYLFIQFIWFWCPSKHVRFPKKKKNNKSTTICYRSTSVIVGFWLNTYSYSKPLPPNICYLVIMYHISSAQCLPLLLFGVNLSTFFLIFKHDNLCRLYNVWTLDFFCF